MSRGGQEVEVIRAERGVAHGLDARRPMVLFQGEPAEQRAVVDDQDEVSASPTCPRQPPRSQEWGGKGGGIEQSVPLRCPLTELRDVYEAGWGHYRIVRGVCTRLRFWCMTQMIFTLSADKMVTLRALSAASMGSTVSVQLRGSASVARVALLVLPSTPG